MGVKTQKTLLTGALVAIAVLTVATHVARRGQPAPARQPVRQHDDPGYPADSQRPVQEHSQVVADRELPPPEANKEKSDDRVATQESPRARERLSRQDVGSALRRANIISAKLGMSYHASAPPELDTASANAILAAYGKYLDDCESVEVIRQPIIHRLATAKEERGDFETVPSPRAADPSLSAKERGSASRQLAAKSKSNRPDQTVVQVGIGGTIRIIRVDADEDPYLTQAYSSLHDIERLFLESIMLVVPNSK